MLQNCTKYTSPAPTTLALPTFTELYQLYRSFTYHSCRPYCYRTAPTIQSCTYNTRLHTVTELYQPHQSCTYNTCPPYFYRTVPTLPVLYQQHSPSLLLQNSTNNTGHLPTTVALPTVSELYQLHQSYTYNTCLHTVT